MNQAGPLRKHNVTEGVICLFFYFYAMQDLNIYDSFKASASLSTVLSGADIKLNVYFLYTSLSRGYKVLSYDFLPSVQLLVRISDDLQI